MKTAFFLPSLLLTLAGLTVPGQAANPVLPADAAVPLGSGQLEGFIIRVVQAPADPPIANSYVRAFRQINGTLRYDDGALVPNEAIAGPNLDGSYEVNLVNFEIAGAPFDQYTPTLFPGVPGSGGHTANFAVEVIGYLQLTAGTHTFGMNVGADRTDVNDDDSYVVFCSANPRSFFGTAVGEYERFAAPFVGNQHNTNWFRFDVPTAGIYPFRILYWQTTRGGNLQFFSVDETTGETILINDFLNNPNAIIAYQSVSGVPKTTSPYVAEVSPLPDSSGIASDEPIRLLLVDGANPIQDSAVRLYLNNTAVTPQNVTRDGNRLFIEYNPSATRTMVDNLVRVEFEDTTGLKVTNSWRFSIVVSGGPRSVVTGQWDFEFGDLRPTVGQRLEYFDPDGSGFTKSMTQFGTTRDFGIPDINGQPALVMRVPGDLDRRIGYVMRHGIAPNGGGTRVNQYTLIMDVYVETTGPGAASLIQISSLNNTDDGDLFWQGNQFGQGTGGYNGTGQFTAGAWHRIVAAYDEAANPPVVTKYADGIKQDDWTANQGLDNPRRALQPTAILFADGDQPNPDERRVMYVNSIQIRSGKLSDAEMVTLGGPDACGISGTLPQVEVAGQWDFERGDLSSTIGKPLQYFDPDASGFTASQTQYGTTTDFGIADINGEAARVMRVPGDLDRRIGYVMTHGIPPNGGGTRVNQYTLIMDVYVEAAGPGAASLLQISSLSNNDDGDLFWQGNQFGQGTGGYNGTGQFTAGEWHRICAAYDEAASPPVVTKYADGIKQDDWTANQGLDNPRRALQPTALLFADGDQPNPDERRVMYVNSVQIRPRKLTDAEMTALGGPQASGIPVALPTSTVAGQWDFERGDLSATVGKALQYFDPDASGFTASQTQFGTTTDLGISDINGEPARVMRVPGDIDRRVGYIMTHGIAPNGGGTRVNQYTFIMDVYVDTMGPGAASFLQISSLNNTDDGDLFWQGNQFGQGTGGYNGTGQFTAGEWHRMCAAYNEAAQPPVVVKYVDGIFQDNWTANQGLDNPRRALQPTALLFADGDVPNPDERRVMYVNSIQIRSTPLSNAEMQALGGPQSTGIPVVVPLEQAPRICLGKAGNRLVLLWSLSAVGYTLESASQVPSMAWAPVPDVASNSAIVEIGSGNKFFRLRK